MRVAGRYVGEDAPTVRIAIPGAGDWLVHYRSRPKEAGPMGAGDRHEGWALRGNMRLRGRSALGGLARRGGSNPRPDAGTLPER